jgi:hypothetical protein
MIIRSSSLIPQRYVRLWLLAFLLASTACHSLTLAEKKIVGNWEFKGLDAVGLIVFRRDHVVVNLFPQTDKSDARLAPVSCGTWRLEGNEIVTDQKGLPLPGYSPSPRQITRMPIREFREDALILAERGSNLERVDLRAERFSQISAALYVIVGLAAMLICIRAIQRAFFRTSFLLLGGAAILELAWAVLLLVTELTQTGDIILSWSYLYCMQVTRIVLASVFLIIFAAGLVSLIRTKTRRSALDRS